MTASVDVRTVELHAPDGSTGGSVELPAEIFDVQANMPLMHQVVVAQLAAARAGTHSTKTRGEVAGGGHKPYRQKGTGRARQGSTRAPQYAGGGVVHGPTPRNYAQRTPKKMKAAALRGALSDRARNGLVHVVSAIVDGDTPSTGAARKLLAGIADSARVLVVVGRDDLVGIRSLRNLSHVHLLAPDQLNTYDVLVSDDVIFTEAALRSFVERTGYELKVEAAPAKPKRTAKDESSGAAKSTPKRASKPKKAVDAPADDAAEAKAAVDAPADDAAEAKAADDAPATEAIAADDAPAEAGTADQPAAAETKAEEDDK